MLSLFIIMLSMFFETFIYCYVTLKLIDQFSYRKLIAFITMVNYVCFGLMYSIYTTSLIMIVINCKYLPVIAMFIKSKLHQTKLSQLYIEYNISKVCGLVLITGDIMYNLFISAFQSAVMRMTSFANNHRSKTTPIQRSKIDDFFNSDIEISDEQFKMLNSELDNLLSTGMQLISQSLSNPNKRTENVSAFMSKFSSIFNKKSQ